MSNKGENRADSNTKRQRAPIGRMILGVVVVAGVLPVVAIAPGLGYAFKKIGVSEKLNDKKYVSRALWRLKAKGYITFEEKAGKRYVRITKRGRNYFNKKRVALLLRPETRPWDGYWRIVMFDIPESQRRIRDALRRELREVGFKKLQESVWVSPDECEEYVKLLKADRHIGKKLIYLKTRDIEYGTALRSLFKITKT